MVAQSPWYIYIYIHSHDKVTALGYVYTLGKQILRSPKCCTSQNATSAEFLDVQIPPCVLVYGWDPWPLSSARSRQKFGGKKKKNMKSETG